MTGLYSEVFSLVSRNWPDLDGKGIADRSEELARNRYGKNLIALSGDEVRELRGELEKLLRWDVPPPSAREREEAEEEAFIASEVKRIYGTTPRHISCSCDVCTGRGGESGE